MHVVVATRQQGPTERLENTRLITTEVVGKNQVQRGMRFRLVVIMPMRVVPATASRHLLICKAEEKKVLCAGFFCHFNRRALRGANGEPAVHQQFQVARPDCLMSAGGDMVG